MGTSSVAFGVGSTNWLRVFLSSGSIPNFPWKWRKVVFVAWYAQDVDTPVNHLRRMVFKRSPFPPAEYGRGYSETLVALLWRGRVARRRGRARRG